MLLFVCDLLLVLPIVVPIVCPWSTESVFVQYNVCIHNKLYRPVICLMFFSYSMRRKYVGCFKRANEKYVLGRLLLQMYGYMRVCSYECSNKSNTSYTFNCILFIFS